MLTRKQLVTTLQAFQIPLLRWDRGITKSVNDLLAELQAGESHLEIRPDGLVRLVRTVCARIHHPMRGVLIEAYQRLANNEKRDRNVLPGGKVKAHETPLEGISRELHEELHLAPTQYTVVGYPTHSTDDRESGKFPGLRTLYDISTFTVQLKNPNRFAEEFAVRDGKKCLVFRWSKDPQFLISNRK